MSNTVDWSSAPEGAEFYADGCFWRDGDCRWFPTSKTWQGSVIVDAEHYTDYARRPAPQENPMKYEYGVEYPTNGVKPDLPDDVLVEQYSLADNKWHKGCASLWNWDAKTIVKFRIVDQRYKPANAPVETKQPTTAAEYLSACAQVQFERGKQYDAGDTGERSFDAAAEAFNCITGKHLRGSDVCLILELVKKVRQYSDPTRLHADSVLDAVSYA